MKMRIFLNLNAFFFSFSNIHLRWVQQNPGRTPGNEFGLQKIYIGPPCEYDCYGHGVCKASGICSCDEGYSGKNEQCNTKKKDFEYTFT